MIITILLKILYPLIGLVLGVLNFYSEKDKANISIPRLSITCILMILLWPLLIIVFFALIVDYLYNKAKWQMRVNKLKSKLK